MTQTDITGDPPRDRRMTPNHLLADAMEPGTIAPRRKRQPTADVMREQLALAAEEIIRLRAELDKPWWRRLMERSNA